MGIEVICLDAADIMTLSVSPGRLPEQRAAAEDRAALLFSGGTTGVPFQR